MSAHANPRKIGLFLIGALILVIIGIAALASTTWFERRTTFVSFFPESVNGLENGAPVKWQGVPVGRVTAIGIQINSRDDSFQVPVEYEIEVPRLMTHEGTYVNLADPAVLQRHIGKGLRAQLQMESLVTGLLFLDLSYRTDSTAPRLVMTDRKHLEIPTTPSLMAAIGGGAGSILSDVTKIIDRVNGLLTELDFTEINAAVSRSAVAVERLVSAPELRATLQQMPATTQQLRRTMADVGRLATTADSAIVPLQAQLTGASAEAVTTLQSLRRTLEDAHGLLSADSGPGYELQGTLKRLREVTESLTQLINSLERNPDMLLRGRRPPGEVPPS